MEIFQALEGWSLAVFLRQSIWAYPLVNTLHLLGVALLIGSVATLDLRVLGLWRQVAPEGLGRVLARVATAGFCLAVLAGPLLFLVQAKTYAALWLFQVKMILLLLAVTNAAMFMRSAAWRRFCAAPSTVAAFSLRAMAVLSLLLWLGVLTFGRLVGYA